jgi:hypothetical protein
MKKLLTTLCAAALAAALFAPAPAAACVNDYDNWGWLQANETQDDEMTERWCHSQQSIDAYWGALNLGDGDGSNWFNAAEGNSCNPNTHFSRVMNAAYIMDFVYYSLLSPTLGQNQYAFYWLVNHVSPHSANGYLVGCNYDPTVNIHTVASNPSGGDDPTNLFFMFFWKLTANDRASTLVHEAVHDWIGHVAPELCGNKCGASCDVSFGPSNAQTWDVTYLDHSVSAYRRADGSDQLAVAHLGDLLGTGAEVCGYIPVLSPEARQSAVDRMNWKFTSCFAAPVTAPPPTSYFSLASDPFWEYGNYEYGYDKAVGARWSCAEICNAAEWGSKCDPAAQPGNAAVNSFNQALCNEENGQLHAGVTPQQRYALVSDFNQRKQGCVPGYSDSYLTGYCGGVSSSAVNVAGLEAAWNLADQPGVFDSGEAMLDCVKSYCQGQYSAQWATNARTACYEWDDSLGCLDAICGSLDQLTTDYGATSQEYFTSVQCRRHFIDHAGDASEYFDAQQNQAHCDRVSTDCRNADARADWLTAKGLGQCSLYSAVAATGGTYDLGAIASIKNYPSYGRFASAHASVSLDQCVAVQQACEATEAMLHKILAEMLAVTRVLYGIERLRDLPDPPPYDIQSEVFQNVRELARIASAAPDPASGFTPEQAIERLRHVPEANQALSIALGQQLYFAVLGADSARESVFGAAKIHAFEGATRPPDPLETGAQTALVQQLDAGKATRERVTSAAAMTLYSQAPGTNMDAFFVYLNALQIATSLDEVDAAYAALDAAI